MWNKIKNWWEKNKKYIIGIFSAFGAGVALTLRFVFKRNAGVDEHIKQLQDRLSELNTINRRLEELNKQYAERLADISDSNSELTKQNTKLRELQSTIATTISGAKSDLDTASAANSDAGENAEQVRAIVERLDSETTGLKSSIEQLENFLHNYGSTDTSE